MTACSLMQTIFDTFEYRYDVLPADRCAVRQIVGSVGFFTAAEVAVAVELVDERLAKGAVSGYHFVFAETEGQLQGYTCYGPIPATVASYDLYWIAVAPPSQGRGMGRALLAETERLVRQSGGRRIYAETSGRELYVPTRAFYERNGYQRAAVLADFYAPEDDKVIYVKVF